MSLAKLTNSILFIQILGTTVISAIFKSVPAVQHWVQGHAWMMWVSLGLTIATLIGLFFVRRKYPINFYLLGAFTYLPLVSLSALQLTYRLLESYTVGTIVSFYDTTIVLEALLITLGLFFGLTLFTLQSKWDFSGMGPFLFGGLWALILAGLIMAFFPHNGYTGDM